MKICYVSAARIPTERPHGYAIAKMCEAFAGLGHTVTLVSPEKTSFMGTDTHGYYGLQRVFNHIRIPTWDLLYWERAGRASFWLDMLSFLARLTVANRKLLRDADIVYTRDPYVALFLPSGNMVLELHTLPADTLPMRLLLRRVRRINAISHGLASDITALCGRTDIVVIPDAVDLNRFAHQVPQAEARRTLGLTATGSVVVYTGNFYPWKGADTLADAAALIPEAHVVLVGGTDEYDYQRIAAKQFLAPNLIVRKFEDASRMPVYLAAADVLVIPNAKGTAISERHTSPLKLFEYMAVGKPIVASDLPSLREILDDSMAVFVQPNDAAALAAGIRRTLDSELASRLGTACMQRVRVYSWEARASAALQNL